MNCHGNSIETQMSEIHTQLIFNSEMSMRASLIRLILSVCVSVQIPLTKHKKSLSYECPIWVTVMVIEWRSIDSLCDTFTFLTFFIYGSVYPLCISERRAPLTHSLSFVLIRGASLPLFDGDACSSMEKQ